MSASSEWLSGKGRHDENFPVASILVARRHRPAIAAFYRFARAADDAADHPSLAPADKRAILDRLEATLAGADDAPEAVPLARVLAATGLPSVHAKDLLAAFRQDVDKSRYATLGELMDYCALSAMPVGRFVLDVHGEDRATWPASDALCAALQIINHLQDCAKDFAALDRVYLPQGILDRHGARIADLGQARASPGLRRAIQEVAADAGALLAESVKLAPSIRDRRLRMEVAVIQDLAERILARLKRFDPLSERVHLSRPQMVAAALGAAAREGCASLLGRGRTVERGA